MQLVPQNVLQAVLISMTQRRRILEEQKQDQKDEVGITIELTSFTLIIVVSALLYLLMQVFVQRKLRLLHSVQRDLDTKPTEEKSKVLKFSKLFLGHQREVGTPPQTNRKPIADRL